MKEMTLDLFVFIHKYGFIVSEDEEVRLAENLYKYHRKNKLKLVAKDKMAQQFIGKLQVFFDYFDMIDRFANFLK